MEFRYFSYWSAHKTFCGKNVKNANWVDDRKIFLTTYNLAPMRSSSYKGTESIFYSDREKLLPFPGNTYKVIVVGERGSSHTASWILHGLCWHSWKRPFSVFFAASHLPGVSFSIQWVYIFNLLSATQSCIRTKPDLTLNLCLLNDGFRTFQV